jgi:hypothetical protein
MGRPIGEMLSVKGPSVIVEVKRRSISLGSAGASALSCNHQQIERKDGQPFAGHATRKA